ncbi:MAG TPA: hypothetical protein VK614_15450 [Allosphingosinicella sp.]|nr:hypothetical protein [Allosphingosinicella sp.]
MSWAELPGELHRFADVVRREPATAATAEFLFGQSARFHQEWQGHKAITATRMPLPRPRDQGLHPVGCQIEASYLSFEYVAGEQGKPPKAADFQVRIDALLVAGDALIELQDHWRIDTEPARDQAAGGAAGQLTFEGREPHPFFHFQRGGRAQDSFARESGFFPSANTEIREGEWKALMQYPGPRIPSLPFDPLLAIDFCIAQNDGLVWRRLRSIPEYFSIVEDAQARLWTPFFNALAERTFRRKWLGPILLA